MVGEEKKKSEKTEKELLKKIDELNNMILEGINNAVRNAIANFIRMSLGDGFTSEQILLSSHAYTSWLIMNVCK